MPLDKIGEIVLFADMLGFAYDTRNRVAALTTGILKVATLFPEVKKLTIKYNAARAYTFSDTIAVGSTDMATVFDFAKDLFRCSWDNEILLRGAIAIGGFYDESQLILGRNNSYNFSSMPILGDGYTRASRIEKAGKGCRIFMDRLVNTLLLRNTMHYNSLKPFNNESNKLPGFLQPVNEYKPDERNLHHPNLTIEDVQAGFLQADMRLSKNIPAKIKERLELARKIGVFAWFQWELYTVSLFWSLTTLEMALRQKYTEVTQNPSDDTSFRYLLKWAEDNNHIPIDVKIMWQGIVTSFNNRFFIETFPEAACKQGILTSSNPTIKDIMELWGSLKEDEKAKFISGNRQIIIEEIPRTRNLLAHPSIANWIFPPREAIECYWQTVEIINHLWD